MRYPPTRVRLPLVLGGIGFTLAAYGIGAAAAAGWPETPGLDSLYLPIAGPWLALGQTRCPDEDPDCGAILYLRGALYILSGLSQLGGLGIAAEGLFATTEADSAPVNKASLALVPLVSPKLWGVGLVSAF
jgi:hypothetical protein